MGLRELEMLTVSSGSGALATVLRQIIGDSDDTDTPQRFFPNLFVPSDRSSTRDRGNGFLSLLNDFVNTITVDVRSVTDGRVLVAVVGGMAIVGSSRAAVQLQVAIATGQTNVARDIIREIDARIADGRDIDSSGVPAARNIDTEIFEVDAEDAVAIIEHKLSQSQKQKNANAAIKENKDNQETQKIYDKTTQALRAIFPETDFTDIRLKKVVGAARGEHVINNDVVNFHVELANAFPALQREEWTNTLSSDTERAIRNEMVYHVTSEDDRYIDANACLYGRYKKALWIAIKCLMQPQYNVYGETEPQLRARIVNIIDNLIKFEVYVDQSARVKWLKKNPKKENILKKALKEVAEYFNMIKRTFEK